MHKFRVTISFFILFILPFSLCSFEKKKLAINPVESGFILNPYHQNQKIEFFSLFPEGKGPFPLMFLLHGYQPPQENIGGKQLVDLNYLESFVTEGIAAIAISIPGFGNSEGIRDFSGPNSQKAVAAVIEYFCQHPLIDTTKIGVYGISRGAILASMLHLYSPNINLQILESGWYDLTSYQTLLPNYLEKIKEGITLEVGDPIEEGVRCRSAIFYPTSNAKTLFLQGEYDDRRGLPSAILLHQKLLSESKDSILKVYPNELHCLPPEKWETIIPFVRKNFLDLYGIGVKVRLIMPAIQIAKIHPGTKAEQQGKLKVGDVILRISPNNDETEIDVLRMPPAKFAQLLLGPKGSMVRLFVQHFDLSFETIEIERG